MAQSEASRADVQSIPLPVKLTKQRMINPVEEAHVKLNAYMLDISNAATEVFKHELKFRGTYPPDKVKDLSSGPKNDIANQTRRKLLWEMFQQMLQGNPDTFGSDKEHKSFIYDCGINFYSTKRLMSQGDEQDFAIDKEKLPEPCRIYLGTRVHTLTATLKACETVNIRSLDAVSETRDRSAVQFLDILTSQEMIKRDSYYIFAAKMFDKQSNIQLQNNQPQVLKEGMQKNVRYVGDTIAGAVPILQVDPKKSAFFPQVMLGEYLEKFLPGRPNDPLERKLNPNTLRAAVKQIKGLTVVTTHMAQGKNRQFEVQGLTEKSADSLLFDCKGQQLSVAAYFQQCYSRPLQYPRLPCVIERRAGKGPDGKTKHNDSYYPIEVVGILAGQRVSFSQQTPSLVEQMIRNCQALPKDFEANNAKQQNSGFLTSGNPYLRSHAVRVDDRLQQAEAEVLQPPAIVYQQNQREEPDQRGQLQWKMQNKRFFHPAGTPQVWAAVIFQNGVQGQQCDQFVCRFLEAAQKKGMQVAKPARYDQFDSTDVGFVREKMKYYKDNNCQFVLFFTRDKLDEVHHTMKLMEVEFGICTQHISKQTMEKAIGQKGAFMVIDNLLLKFNLKLGGVNHGLSTSQVMARGSRLDHDIVEKKWLSSSRMFIGIDMSHAAPQSVYERQAKIACKEPTIVGMCYTVGHPVRMRGTYWCQESRVTHVMAMVPQIKEAIGNYASEMRGFPQHLVVFRGGVSEGEYRIVVAEEKTAFDKAFQEMAKEHPDFRTPALTIVVVQKNSNYRIVPSNVQGVKAFEQNVRAGTCVDKKVMHPATTEFLLVGHRTIQGTAQPIRCTVVSDSEPRMPLEEIEYVTYGLCYAHGIVMSPVSIPAPLYSASDLAKRGRNNHKAKNFDSDTMSMASGGSGGSSELPPHYFVNMSDGLKPKLTTKFWA